MFRTYLKLKGCPKCKGDLIFDRSNEDAEVCLQCGLRIWITDKPASHARKVVSKTGVVRRVKNPVMVN